MVISPLKLNLNTVDLTEEQFYQLCQNNRELKFERTTKGELVIMSPVGGESGNREADLITDFRNLESPEWNGLYFQFFYYF